MKTKSCFARRLVLLLALLFTTSSWAMDVDRYTSGGWGDPSQSGHGYSIEVMNDNLAIIFWYVYNPDGTSTFLVTVGQISGNTISGNTSYYSGMKFGEFDPSVLQEDPWGTVTVTFHDCNNATLNYSSSMSHNGVPFGSGTVQLQRLVSLQGMGCTDNPLAGNYHITAIGPDGVSLGAGIVFENGDFAYFVYSESSAEVGLAGMGTTGPDTFGFGGTEYDLFGGATDFSGSGNFNEDDLEGTYNFGTNFIATRMMSFQHKLPMQVLAGTYSITDMLFETHVGTVTISGTGQVSGTTTDGCDLSGIVFVPNQNFNQFYIDIDLDNCATPMNIIGGGGYDFDEDLMIVVGADGTTGYAWELQ